MDLRYTTLDVFTDRPFGGNPLAVFCDQPAISDERMQTIAREFNLSETVFIVPSWTHARCAVCASSRRRMSSPSPATRLSVRFKRSSRTESRRIGAEGGTFVLELEVGLVPIRVTRSKGERPFHQLTTARLPEKLGHSPSSGDLARILSLTANDIAQAPVEAWSCGVPFLFVPLRDRAALAKAKPNTGIWSDTLKGAGTSSVFVFCTEPTLRAPNVRPRPRNRGGPRYRQRCSGVRWLSGRETAGDDANSSVGRGAGLRNGSPEHPVHRGGHGSRQSRRRARRRHSG